MGGNEIKEEGERIVAGLLGLILSFFMAVRLCRCNGRNDCHLFFLPSVDDLSSRRQAKQ